MKTFKLIAINKTGEIIDTKIIKANSQFEAEMKSIKFAKKIGIEKLSKCDAIEIN